MIENETGLARRRDQRLVRKCGRVRATGAPGSGWPSAACRSPSCRAEFRLVGAAGSSSATIRPSNITRIRSARASNSHKLGGHEQHSGPGVAAVDEAAVDELDGSDVDPPGRLLGDEERSVRGPSRVRPRPSAGCRPERVATELSRSADPDVVVLDQTLGHALAPAALRSKRPFRKPLRAGTPSAGWPTPRRRRPCRLGAGPPGCRRARPLSLADTLVGHVRHLEDVIRRGRTAQAGDRSRPTPFWPFPATPATADDLAACER